MGDVDAVNTSLLTSLLLLEKVLVFAPITHDGKGQLLNTNADTIAQELARGLSATFDISLVYSFEKSGVLLDAEDDATVISRIGFSAYYQELKKNRKMIFAGMIPKMDNAFAALRSGVGKVIIGRAEELPQLLTGQAVVQLSYMSNGQNHKEKVNGLPVLQAEAIDLLRRLIGIPSFSKEEAHTASAIEGYLRSRGVHVQRLQNNVWAKNLHFDADKPTILLNSHHDTVKPNKGYTLDPFQPLEKDGQLFGLGSNDAGGCLVSLIATFLYYYDREGLTYNLVLAATAEEEISGHDGIELLLPSLGKIDFGIVGEPTQMQLAVAEKGLLVLDCVSQGKAGHAAREEGDNAIYKALKDIEWFHTYKASKVSDLLGPVKMSVTVIDTDNRAHNVSALSMSFRGGCESE